MIVIADCHEKISRADCQFGGRIFDGIDFAVYINNWLDGSADIRRLFNAENDERYVDHRKLQFENVESCKIRVRYYSCAPDNRVIWRSTQEISYAGIHCFE